MRASVEYETSCPRSSRTVSVMRTCVGRYWLPEALSVL